MNKTYRIVWNETTNTWVAVAEIAKAHGKSASVGGGIVASCTQVGARFAFTAAASAVLMMGAPAMAATVTDGTGINAIVIQGASSTATAVGQDSLAAGTNAAADGKSALAIGTNSIATGENATAYGNMTKATANNATAFGSLSQATAQSATAVGDGAEATAGQTTAVGVGTTASAAGATAVGHTSQATADHATALGSIANASAARAVAVGYNVTASQIDAVAVGSNAIANQANAVAVGVNAKAQNNSNIAIGNLANATGATSAISIGRESVASNTSTVAMGYKAQASGTSAIAVGSGSLASGISAIAIGNGSDAAGERTTVIGSRNGNVAASYSAIVGIGNAITSTTDVQVYGNTNTISRSNTYVLGSNNTVSGATESAVIAGRQNTMSGTNGVAVGRLNTVAGSSAVAIGQSSQALGTDGIALGNKAYANTGQNAIALGGLTHAGQFGTALGARASVTGDQGLAAATGAVVEGARAVAVGSYSFAGTEDAVALGHNTAATGSRAVVIGAGSVVSGARSGAWGIATNGGQPQNNTTDRSFVGGTDSYAIGNKNIIGNTSSDSFVLGNNVKLGATGASIAITNVAGKDGTTNASTRTNTVNYTGATAITGAVALGSDTSVAVNNGVALGKSSVAGTAAGQVGADPLSAVTDKTSAVWTSTLSAVSVGDIANNKTRQITSVAAGTQDTDAVNVAQLKAAITHYYSVNDNGTQGGNYNNNGATGANSLAAGVGAAAATENSVAVGYNAQANTNTGALAIGSNTTSSGTSSVALGTNSSATGQSAVGVGNLAKAGGKNAVAIGESANATGSGNVAIGESAGKAHSSPTQIQGNNTVLIGVAAGAEAANNQGQVSVGWEAGQGTLGAYNVASGYQAGQFVNGQNNVAFGKGAGSGTSTGARLTASDTVSVGTNAQATKDGAIAIGTSTVSGSTNSIVLGTNAKVEREVSTSNVIIGHDAQAIASTTSTTDVGKDAVAIGFKSQVGAASNVALGSNAKATGNSQATAVGYNTSALGYQSSAFGSGANTAATAGSSLALGKDASATVANGVALGSGSVANVAFGQTGADPLNVATDKTTSTWKATHAAVSVGNGTTVTRQITSVAAGTKDTDAVNVAQLKAAGFTLAASNAGGGESTTVPNDKIQNGETVTVDAGKNIKVTHTANTVSIATKDDVAFTTVTTKDATGNQTVLNGAGMTITPTGGANPVSLTSAGLNNGGNKITNVADGNIASGSKEAVNGGQIFDLKQELTANSGNISKGLDFAGNTGEFNRQLGEKTTISGGLTSGSSSNSNIRTVANNGTIDIQLADAPVFTGKVSAQGLDAGGQKITNVAKGSDDADAVNVKQLQESLANITVTNQLLVQANSPFSYVNSAGEQLIRHVDGSGNITFIKASDGSTYSNSDITISALNPSAPQTATPTTVGNIANGKANNDAVNVSQLKNAVEVLGAGATVNSDGTIKQPTYTVKGNTFSNVGGAIDALDEAVQTPLTFSGDNATEKVKRELGTELAVKGGSTATLTDGNIGVVGSATDNSLTIKLAEKINLGTAGSVTTGDTKVDNAGVTIASAGKTPVSLTNAGLDNGGNVISNVGAGKADTDAVNVSQLTPLATALGVNVDPNSGIVAAPSFVVTKTDGTAYAGETTIQGALNNIGTEIQKGITFTGNSGQAVKKLGETFNIKGTLDNAADASDKNIRTEVDGNGVMSIKLAESPKFGNVTINDAGKITGVTAGTQDTDAVNVAQLNDKTATTPLIVGNTGAVDTPADANKLVTAGGIADAINKAGFTLTTAKTTDGELGATATNELINAGDTVTVEADKNIKVTQTNGKISIATKDAVSFNNVTVGNTTIDNSGITIKAPTGGTTTDVKLTADGLDNGGNKITNVANGDVTSASKDAINGSQLRNTADDIASIIGGNAAVDNAGNVTASNIGGTTATTIDDAIKTVKTTVKSTDNTIKVTANTADATKGTVFDISVDAQKMAESAQLPVVYTDANGNKVYKVNGKFTKDPTGQDANQEVAAANVIASMQNADGTISPTTLANIKAGTNDTDAVNVGQLKGAVDALGGGATINADGTIKAPTYNITNPANGTVTTANNVGDALKGLNDAVNSPLTFKGDSGEFNRNLGQTTTVKGGITDTTKLSDNNIGVVAKDGTLDIKLAKDIAVDSVTTGGTKLSDAGLSFVDASGSPVANSPSISKTGINAGNQVIAGVKAGTQDTDAVNVAQLNDKTATTPLTVGNTGAVDTPATADVNKLATAGDIANAINKAGFTLTTAKTTDGELGANSTSNELINAGDTVTVEADKNIKVTQTNGKISIATKDAVSFNSVTAGTGTNQVVLGDDGVKVGGKTYISDAGLNANDKKITNVANGDITSTSKDAINGSQLRNTADDIASIIGGDATVDDAGNVTASNIGGTTATTIDDAIKTVKTTVKSTDNTIKVTANTADATKGTVFDISVDAQKMAESAQLPVVYTDANGNKVYKVNGKFTKDPTGQDANQEVAAANVIASMQNADGTISPTTLANIKAGTNDTDAVNVGQLKGAVDALGGGATINADGTIKAPTYNITNPANGTVTTANNVGDALKGLNDAVNSPLTFKGDSGEFNRNLGQTTTVKGGITDTAKLSDNNIGVVAKDGALDIKLAKDIAVDSVKAGDTTVNTYGVSIANADPNKVVSLTAGGLNNGNNRITNVAAGQAGTDAVNKDQLDAAKTAATTKVVEGKNVKVTEQNNTDGSKTYTVATADEVEFNKATVGGVVVDGTSNKVSGLANGDVSATSTDAINGSQLFATNQNVANNATEIAKGINVGGTTGSNNYALGDTINVKGDSNISSETVEGGVQLKLNDVISVGTAKPVKIDGTKGTVGGLTNTAWDANNIVSGQAATEDQLKSAVSAAQAAATTKVVEGKNVKVTGQPNNDGSTTYTVATADEVAFDKVSVGNVTIDSTTNKISGLANGNVSATSTDAINGSQLYGTANSVATALGGGATVQADGTVSAPTYNITNPADGTVTKANNVGDALKGLNDAVNSPLIFAGDSGKNVERKLGTTLGIKGGVTDAAKLSQNNIGVVSNGTDTLEIQLAKELTGLTSVSTGNTVMNNDGVTITGAGGAKPVSLTNAGLDNGGNKITNVAAGTDATDAVNKDQLDKAQAAASNKIKAGDNIEVAESKNADGSTTYTVATAKDLTVDSVKAGDTTINNAGVTVGDKVALTNTGLTTGDVKVGTDGINAGNKVITGVASGLNGKTLDQIKADSSAPERSNAATIGDLAEVQSNVTNISDNYNTTVNQVIGGTTPDGKVTDANGNPMKDNSGNAIDVSDALKTYNVSGNHAKTDNTLVTAIKNINEGGIKFFHVNDGTGEQNVVGSDVHNENSTASGSYSAAIGYQAKSTGENAIAIGVGSSANAKNTIAIGTGNIVNGENSGAIGDPSIINGANSYSVGNNNTVATDSTFVLGNNVTQTLANSVILGDKSSATEVHTTANGGNYTFAGANDANVAGVNDVVGVVSVGTEGETRQVQNVAAGVVSADSTDAINGSQLYYTNEAIGNVANYAVNMGNQLSNRIDDVEDGANAGVSSAMAMASLPQAYIPGKSMLTGGMASYNGEGAVAVGLSKLSDNGRWVMKISGSADTKGNAGAAIGAGFHF